MLPNKYILAFACKTPDVISVIAIPTDIDKIIAKIRSVYFRKYCLKNSIASPPKEVNKNAEIIGLLLKKSPKVTPARDACANVSPIIE